MKLALDFTTEGATEIWRNLRTYDVISERIK